MDTLAAIEVALFILVGAAGITMPFLRYLTVGWRAGCSDLLDGFPPAGRAAYFDTFDRGGCTTSDEDQANRMEEL